MPESEITHGAAVAVLRILGDDVRAKTTEVRDTAKAHFRDIRARGTKSMIAQLPDGSEVGRITITDPSPVVKWRGRALVDFVQKTAPTEVVDRVDPSVLSDPELVLWVLQNRPEAIRSEVRDAYRNKLRKQLTEVGELVDQTTGEVHKVAEIERPEPDGSFSYRPSDDAHELVLAAWRSGALSGLGGVFAALGAPPTAISTTQATDAEGNDDQ
ncbi:hypothetical protein [Nocardiopsis alba]|uniref:hypothetical protein n=1 Tax=Nocardiopsis alba TaxID=53437 RepID=UPI0035DD7A32